MKAGAMNDLSAERIAKNDATFRDANERIQATAETHGLTDSIPFICECAAPECSTIVRLSADEYEEIRRDSTHFLNAPGHHTAGGPHVRVVEAREGYELVEKLGRAAEIVEELDPRGGVRD
jgi:hypothetical protein